MAVNKVVYNGQTLIDTSNDTVAPNTLLKGITAHDRSGEVITGTFDGVYTADEIATNAQPSGEITLTATTINEYAFASKPITNIYAPNCKRIEKYGLAFTELSKIADDNFPALEGIADSGCANMKHLTRLHLTGADPYTNISNVFRYDTALIIARLPNNSRYVQGYAFGGCSSLEIADMGKATSIIANAFNGANKLQTLILRNTTVASLSNVSAFVNTPFKGYKSLTGTVYVPSALISKYQKASNWKTLYTAGTCNFVALEGSAYEDIDWTE